jgi:hypothetical protein
VRTSSFTQFRAATTAGNATIDNNSGGFLQFGTSEGGTDTATAGNATINNSGTVSFNARTTAGSAQITTNNGASLFFFDGSTGGNAQIITNAGGTFDMSGLTGGRHDCRLDRQRWQIHTGREKSGGRQQ